MKTYLTSFPASYIYALASFLSKYRQWCTCILYATYHTKICLCAVNKTKQDLKATQYNNYQINLFKTIYEQVYSLINIANAFSVHTHLNTHYLPVKEVLKGYQQSINNQYLIFIFQCCIPIFMIHSCGLTPKNSFLKM